MGWTGGSNSFFLLDHFIEFGDGLRNHLIKFFLANDSGVTNCKEAAAQGCRINIINLLQCRKFIIFAAVQKIYNFGQRAKIEALLFLMWVLFYAHD